MLVIAMLPLAFAIVAIIVPVVFIRRGARRSPQDLPHARAGPARIDPRPPESQLPLVRPTGVAPVSLRVPRPDQYPEHAATARGDRLARVHAELDPRGLVEIDGVLEPALWEGAHGQEARRGTDVVISRGPGHVWRAIPSDRRRHGGGKKAPPHGSAEPTTAPGGPSSVAKGDAAGEL